MQSRKFAAGPMIRIVLQFSLLLISAGISAQRIVDFNLYETNASVLVRFSLTAGPQCNGWTLERSADSVVFVEIHPQPGVCGDFNNRTEFSYTDGSPLPNATNYYRVRLDPHEISQTRGIYVGAKNYNRLTIYPNPVGDFSTNLIRVRFSAGAKTRLIGNIYGPDGLPAMPLDFITSASDATIDIGNLRNGLYLLWVNDGVNMYYSKFIIRR